MTSINQAEMQLCDPTTIHGLRDKDLKNFYVAAKKFYESSVWVGLSATQHREIFLSKPVKSNFTYKDVSYDPSQPANEDTVPESSTIGRPIFICGLQISDKVK